MVFVSHAHDLSGHPALAILSASVSSTMAVQAFFVISGFLIFQSYDKSPTIRSYTAKRVRRILPGYATVILVCAVLLSLISKLPPDWYFGDPGLYKYLIANLVFLNFLSPNLPGVFEGNIVQAVNGALWTLKIEVAFYVAVPVCVWLFTRLGRDRMMAAIYVASVAYAGAMLWLAVAWNRPGFVELSRQLPGQMTYFIAGAAIYYHFYRFRARPFFTFAIGLLTFAVSMYVFSLVLRPIGLALCVMSIAYGPYLGKFARYGDFSYGIYIVHFPILQTLVYLGLPKYSPWVFLFTAIAIVLPTAFLMWHLVEKRFLRRDSHYRAESVSLSERSGSR
jgi:peptidoglycan/LPS O-acetylase OafA/YrhL